MTLEAYFEYGGVEVVNSNRVAVLSKAAGLGWIMGPTYPQLANSIYGADFADITTAPWYDANQTDLSSRFFGVYGLGVAGLSDSVKTTPVTQNAGDGGVLGLSRKGTKTAVVTATLLANGEDAMEYGMAWLQSVLDLDNCASTEDCSRGDVLFFSALPTSTSDAATKTRFLKYAGVTSGPIAVNTYSARGIYNTDVEWTWTSEKPYVFGPPREIALTVDTALALIQDSPINWIPYPSAELTTVNPILENLCTNPRGDSGVTTSWAAIPGTTGVAAITAVAPTAGSTPVGTKVFHTAWTTASTAAGGGCSYTMPAASVTPGLSYSFQFVQVKSSIVTQLQMQVLWYNASNALLSTSTATSFATTAGGVITGVSVSNVQAPAGADHAVVQLISVTGGSFAEWSIGSYLEVTGLMIIQGSSAAQYFDGDFTYPAADYNLEWLGTAELSASTAQVVPFVARNANTNPSVESSATNWAGAAATTSGTSPASYFTSGASTDCAALGVEAFEARIFGNGSTAVSSSVAAVTITDTVSIAAVPSTKLVQLSIWAAKAILAGSSTAIGALAVTAQFLNSSNAQVGSTQTLTADSRGLGVYSTGKIAIPSTATQVKFFVAGSVTWTSGNTDATNSDARIYADAATVAYFGGV